ncbi:MAG: hypothetical protein V4447_12890 [Pseudomonadota bacterium]
MLTLLAYFPDISTALGALFSASLGVWYFFSPSRRLKKQKQWSAEGGMKAISEWGEWLFGFMLVLVFLLLALGIVLKTWF